MQARQATPASRWTTSAILLLFTLSQPMADAQEAPANFLTVNYPLEQVYLDFPCETGTADQQGMVYFGGDSGIIRFDGARWQHICDTPISRLISNSEGRIYGRLLHRNTVVQIARKGRGRLEPVSLNDALLRAGLPSDKLDDFQNFSRVGTDVYLTQFDFIARVRASRDGSNQIQLIKRGDLPDSSLWFHQVFEVNGRAMVQCDAMSPSNRQLPFRTHFGWVTESGDVELLEDVELREDLVVNDRVVDCAAFDSNGDATSDFLCVGITGLHRVHGSQAEKFRPSGIPDGHLPLKVSSRPSGGCVLALAPRGFLLLDRDGSTEGYFQGTRRGVEEPYTVDALDRVWAANRFSIDRIDTDLAQRTWSLPGDAPVRSLAAVDDTLAASSQTKAYYARLLDDSVKMLTTFREIPGVTTDVGTRIRAVGSQIFVMSNQGLFVWDPDRPDQEAVEIKKGRKRIVANDLFPIANDKLLASSRLNTRLNSRLIFQLTGGPGAWKYGKELRLENRVKEIARSANGDVWCTQAGDAAEPNLLRVSPDMATQSYPQHGRVFAFEGRIFILDSEQVIHRYEQGSDQFVEDDELNRFLQSELKDQMASAYQFRTGERDLLLTNRFSTLARIRRVDSKLRLYFAARNVGILEAYDGKGRLWMTRHERLTVKTQPSNRPIPPFRVALSDVRLTQPERARSTEKNPEPSPKSEHYPPLQRRTVWQYAAEFDWTVGTLHIGCSVPMSQKPEAIRYSTRMLGIAEAWSPPAYQNQFQFPALPGGDYTFEVRALQPNGQWSKASSLSIVVHPKWYQTRAFRWTATGGSIALLFLGSSALLVAQRRRLHVLNNLVQTQEQTERQLRESQAKLVQRERLDALGEMAASIAHEINNLLNPIAIYSGLIREDKVQPGDVADFNESILRCVNDAAEIITKLNPLSRAEPVVREPCNLITIVNEVTKLLEIQLEAFPKKKIDINLEMSPAITMGSPTELREVLLNLGTNGCDAIEMAGTVTYRCRTEEKMVVVEVEDDGCGMADDVLKRCTDSFYSTKGESGMGLGLAIADAIVRSFGGSIEFQRGAQSGTLVRIELLSQNALTVRPNKPDDSIVRRTGPYRIAVVDDIESTRVSLELVLKSHGHSVIAFDDPTLLIDYIGEHNDIDLLLTDYRMPIMNGAELSRRVREQRPNIRIIITSGYESPGVHEQCDIFIPKPITIDAMRNAVAEAMR